MNLQNIVENRLNENPQPPIQRLEASLDTVQSQLSDLTMMNRQLYEDMRKSQNSLAHLKNTYDEQNRSLQTNISLLMTSFETANSELNKTTQLALKTVRKNTVGWSFKVWLLLNSIFNIGTIIFVLYFIKNL